MGRGDTPPGPSVTFLAPLALGLLAALPLIYLAHLLRGHRTRLRVSSTWLWRELPLGVTSQQRRLRLTPLSLLLLLQLLAAAAGALGVARLATSGQPPRHVAFVLDASASMQATDVSPTRFESAKNTIADLIDTMGLSDHLSLITMARTPQVLIAQSQSLALCVRVIMSP